MYEVMDLFGLINTDEFGYKTYSDEAITFTTEILDIMKEHFWIYSPIAHILFAIYLQPYALTRDIFMIR